MICEERFAACQGAKTPFRYGVRLPSMMTVSRQVELWASIAREETCGGGL